MDYEVRLTAFDASSITSSTDWFLLVTLDPTRTTAQADRNISHYLKCKEVTLPTSLRPSFSECNVINSLDLMFEPEMNTYLFFGVSLSWNLAVLTHGNHVRRRVLLVDDRGIDYLLRGILQQ